MWNIILDFDGRFWCTDDIVAPVAGTATSSTSSFHLWLLASQEGEQSDVRSY